MYDVLVVGARCAGSLTAMLLAAGGHRVLVIDGDAVDRDVLCGHYLVPAGVSALAAHGILEPLLATGCPAADSTRLFIGATTLEMAGMTCSPRRRVLDALVADAAARASASCVRASPWSESWPTPWTVP